jgi:hypothetical protein
MRNVAVSPHCSSLRPCLVPPAQAVNGIAVIETTVATAETGNVVKVPQGISRGSGHPGKRLL